jgi:hypothetical protein
VSVEILEKHTSRQFSTSATRAEGTWRYVLRVLGEAFPETAIIAAVAADAPFFWYNLVRQELQAEPLGGGLYEVVVPYVWELPNSAAQDPTATPDPVTGGPGGGVPSGTPTGPAAADAPLGPNVSLDFGGRPPKLIRSYAVDNVGEKAGGGDAPDHKGLLGITDGKVEGIEVPDPDIVLTVDVKYDYWTMGLVNLLTSARWHTNLSDWWFVPAGCAAFMGATLQSDDNGRGRASLKFGLIAPRTVLENELRDDAGKELPTANVDVRGWDLLEIEYGDEFDTPSGVTAKRPVAYRVHALLPPLDFSAFGIGV